MKLNEFEKEFINESIQLKQNIKAIASRLSSRADDQKVPPAPNKSDTPVADTHEYIIDSCTGILMEASNISEEIFHYVSQKNGLPKIVCGESGDESVPELFTSILNIGSILLNTDAMLNATYNALGVDATTTAEEKPDKIEWGKSTYIRHCVEILSILRSCLETSAQIIDFLGVEFPKPQNCAK